MDLFVQKFGGTSVGSAERIQAVANHIKRYQPAKCVVVVSAMGGQTDKLVKLSQQIASSPNLRELDALLSCGELISSSLVAMALEQLGMRAISLSGQQAGISTDTQYGKSRIKKIDKRKITKYLDQGLIPVVAGFQGINASGSRTTLGRGGSDTTAVAIACALQAKECHIYTDVAGIYTTDPRVCKNARLLPEISFDETIEIASLGAKVLQIRSVELAGNYKMPVRVLSSMLEDPFPGTLIHFRNQENNMEKPSITSIAFSRDETKITLKDIPDKPGIAASIFVPIAKENINVDVIVQTVSTQKKTNMSFTVPGKEAKLALATSAKIAKDIKGTMSYQEKVAKLSLIGIGMISHTGIASKMFSILAKEKINIQLISTSEIKISVIIDTKHLDRAIKALHSGFDLGKKPTVKKKRITQKKS